MNWIIAVVAALHAIFCLSEIFPWPFPILLQKISEKHLREQTWGVAQQKLVVSIVQNAGIYNGILAGGLFWAAYAGDEALDTARVLLIGAIVAGIFGALTLKSWPSAVQAIFGLIAIVLV